MNSAQCSECQRGEKCQQARVNGALNVQYTDGLMPESFRIPAPQRSAIGLRCGVATPS